MDFGINIVEPSELPGGLVSAKNCNWTLIIIDIPYNQNLQCFDTPLLSWA
jgi:hypothetical protein